jgi:glutaredoxin
MLDQVKDVLYRAITSPRGDSLALVRLPKDLARRLNTTLGSPLGSADDLSRRRAARERLAALRSGRAERQEAKATREAAPVMVYFEKDRNARELGRIEETLQAKSIAYKLLDVTGDEAAMSFVLRQAHCERDELPVVFVGDAAIGGFRPLVAADVSGALERALYGG